MSTVNYVLVYYVIIVIQYTNNDVNDYTTEPVVVSDIESDHVIVMDTHIRGSLEDIDVCCARAAISTYAFVSESPIFGDGQYVSGIFSPSTDGCTSSLKENLSDNRYVFS